MAERSTQQFSRGQTILLEGTPGDRTFRILSGEVVICKKSSSGKQVPLAKLGAGEMFGEMYLFSQDLSRTASAIALSSEVNLEVVPHDEVRTMMKGLHPAINRIFEGLSIRLHRVTAKYVQTVSAREAQRQVGVGHEAVDSNTYIHRPATD
jgi:CRP/FNR family transcriptional regulator, cyclic AMP receptor protein